MLYPRLINTQTYFIIFTENLNILFLGMYHPFVIEQQSSDSLKFMLLLKKEWNSSDEQTNAEDLVYVHFRWIAGYI